MKQTIAIICDFCSLSSDYILTGTGGSETWVIEISKQFAQNNYYVMIFSQNEIWLTFDYNIEYIPIHKLENVISHVKIDYTFIFRYIWNSTLDIMSKYINNHNLFWVCHDTSCLLDNQTLTLEKINSNKWLKNNLNKFICMSEFGKLCIQNDIPLEDNYFQIIGNGINFNYIKENNNIERDNCFLWSSRWERGLELFVLDIFPKIKEKYPESKIYVAQYTGELPEHLLNHEDIIFLGKLSKENLYNEMKKHKVCFYPNFYPETFCITVLEAILCDNELVTKFDHGIITTLSLFKDILLDPKEEFNENISNKIIEKLENYNKNDRIIIRNIMKNYIINNYSWENIYRQFKKYILI